MLTGLTPIIGDRPAILILGSMPSVASLEKKQYYGHPRNAFWPILARLFEFSLSEHYHQNVEQAHQHHVAIWDVIGQCERPGSMDSAIVKQSIVINPILELLDAHPTINIVGLNGGASATLFKRHIEPHLKNEVHVTTLPSTSPANASMTVDEKYRAWRTALAL